MSHEHNEIHNDKPSAALSAISSEAREEALPDLDFDKMEKALMARVDSESQRRRFRTRGAMVAGVLAVAAAAVLVVSRPSHTEQGPSALITADPGAGALESGNVTLRGKALSRGVVLRQGDSVESAYAVFRSDGRVIYSLGDDQAGQSGQAKPGSAQAAQTTEVSVTNTDLPIVLALSHGVVEAQVDKVSSGEAFAVDVPSVSLSSMKNAGPPESNVRIAVHGTHLRVARTGNHVTLDLTEGVVSVGHPPKTGMTNGTTVTAPAHAEFDADALEDTFTMTNELSHVRAATQFGQLGQGKSASTQASREIAHDDSKNVVAANAANAANPSDTNHPEKKPVSQQQAGVNAGAKDPAAVAAVDNNAIAPIDPNKAATDAVVACVREKVSPGEVKLTVTTTLSLRIGDDGSMQAARFDPPLDPAAQQCAANAVAKVRFTKPGSVMLPISVER